MRKSTIIIIGVVITFGSAFCGMMATITSVYGAHWFNTEPAGSRTLDKGASPPSDPLL